MSGYVKHIKVINIVCNTSHFKWGASFNFCLFLVLVYYKFFKHLVNFQLVCLIDGISWYNYEYLNLYVSRYGLFLESRAKRAERFNYYKKGWGFIITIY